MPPARPGSNPMPALAVRLGVIGAIFALAVVLQVRGVGPYSERQLTALYALVVAGLLLALASAAVAGVGRPRVLTACELAAEGMLISALVYATSGAGSLFAFLYHVWIVHAAMRLGSRGAGGAAVGALLAYAILAWGPLLGWLRPFDLWSVPTIDEAMIGTGTHGSGFLVVAVLANGLVRQVRQGRAELRELGEIHRRVFDNVSSGLMTLDRAGRVTSFNPEAERITGYAQSEVLGHSLETLFERASASAPIVQPPLGTREQVRFRNRAGEVLHLGFSSSQLRDEDGEPDGAVLIFQDLTRVVEMEAELRRSERLSAVGQLAAGLAHEIRNPLGALSGALELLAADWSVSQPDGRLFGIVKRETERLNRLVSDFLSYARSGPGRRQRVPLASTFEELAKLWVEDSRRDAVLEIDVPDGLSVEGDPDQLNQVFWNLLLNASEAEPRDGCIRVSARRVDEAQLEVVVADSGAGIPPELVDRIFEPFFTTKARGTGLGLATVHRLVEAAGGSISVRSDAAEGTRVRVILPAANA